MPTDPIIFLVRLGHLFGAGVIALLFIVAGLVIAMLDVSVYARIVGIGFVAILCVRVVETMLDVE